MERMRTLDVNADVGESSAGQPAGDDAALIPLITSANVACGAHAGDPETMRRTLRLAIALQVAVGAHPGYFDREGFGRRAMDLSQEQVQTLILYQVGALDAIARSLGAAVGFVKPHGALYNQAESDPKLARAIVRAVEAYGRPLRLVGRAGSAMEEAARAAGVPFAAEAFADRRYRRDGSLLPRSQPGAVHTDEAAVAEQVRSLVSDGAVRSDDGTAVPVSFDTLCLHGDTPGAPALAARVRRELESLGVSVRPLPPLPA